jgi:hypothetical protein
MIVCVRDRLSKRMLLCYISIMICEWALLIEPRTVRRYVRIREISTLNYAETSQRHMTQQYRFRGSEMMQPYVQQTDDKCRRMI